MMGCINWSSLRCSKLKRNVITHQILRLIRSFNKSYLKLLDIKRRYLVIGFCAVGMAVMVCIESVLEEIILNLRPISHSEALGSSKCNFTQIVRNATQEGATEFTDIDYAIFRAWYFTGRALTTLPATLLAEIIGPKFGMFLGVFGSSITILALFFTDPIKCMWCLNMFRMVQGIWQAFYVVSITVCITRWIPQEERAFGAAIVYSFMLIQQILPYLAIYIDARKDRQGLLQWEGLLVFYALWSWWWSALFLLSAPSLPDSDQFVNQHEYEYLQTYIDSRLPPHWWSDIYPWKQMLTSLPVWVGILANIGSEVVIYTNFHYFTEYFSSVLKLNKRQVSMVQVFIGATSVMMAIVMGVTADQLIHYIGCNKGVVRKMYAILGIWIPMVGMIFGPNFILVRCEKIDVLNFFGVLAPFVSLTLSSQSVNMMDLTPRFAGMASGFVITFQSLGNIVFTIAAGFILYSNTWQPWMIMFFLVGSVSILTTYIFVIWGKTDVQSWDSI